MKKCSRCGQEKQITEFYWNKATNRHLAACRACHQTRGQAYRIKNKERLREADRKWREKNREKIRAAQERFRQRNPGRAAETQRRWREKNPERVVRNARNNYLRWRELAFSGYGGYVCRCCGETNPGFMTLDHVNGDGAKHRKELTSAKRRGSGTKLYMWIVENNWPKTIQPLCYNCNCGRHRNGGVCPHKNPEGSTTIPKGSRAKRPEMRGPSKK